VRRAQRVPGHRRRGGHHRARRRRRQVTLTDSPSAVGPRDREVIGAHDGEESVSLNVLQGRRRQHRRRGARGQRPAWARCRRPCRRASRSPPCSTSHVHRGRHQRGHQQRWQGGLLAILVSSSPSGREKYPVIALSIPISVVALRHHATRWACRWNIMSLADWPWHRHAS